MCTYAKIYNKAQHLTIIFYIMIPSFTPPPACPKTPARSAEQSIEPPSRLHQNPSKGIWVFILFFLVCTKQSVIRAKKADMSNGRACFSFVCDSLYVLSKRCDKRRHSFESYGTTKVVRQTEETHLSSHLQFAFK